MIEFKNASFRYPVYRHKMASTENVSEVGGTIINENGRIYVEALKNINLKIEEGSRVGLIGLNGSGKSTFLKICAGILPLTSGTLNIQGDISTLFSATIFSNPHSTGVENIHLLGAICGLRRKEIAQVVEDVREFSELGAFMEMPVRTYSAGMRSRLGFGFATSLRRDILLVDEVIGAGDIAFYEKARVKVSAMLESASTIVMASHSMAVIKTFCTKVIWVKNGNVEAYGDVDTVTYDYVEYVKEIGQKRRDDIRRAQETLGVKNV